jgi:Flp pilus assembly pilin Flp
MRTGRRRPGSRPPKSFPGAQRATFLHRLLSTARAVSAVEYALLVALIGVAILTATMRLGTSVSNTFNNAEAAQKSGETFNVL